MNQSQEIAPEADRVMINHAREIIEGFTRRNTQRISEILVFETRRQLENSSQYVSDTTVWSSEYHMRIRDAY